MSLIAAKSLFLLTWFAAVVVVERAAPSVPRDDRPTLARARLLRNAGMWALAAATSALLVAPVAAMAAAAPLWRRPEALSGPVGFAVSFLALDLWTYCLHRAYHRSPLLWRLHAPHHLDERLDASSALRFHFAEVAISGVLRLGVIMLIAAPFAHVVLFEAALLASAIFHHSNIRLPPSLERAIATFLVTPSIHWVHHHARAADTNANYAGILSVWDRLFGTRSPTQRRPGMKIGIEGVEDPPLAALILWPLKRRLDP